MAAGMLAATSCSDFSDYNEAPVDAAASGNKTLWENISENPQLSDFAALVTRAGFQQELLNARSYTVWAPVNGSFNVSAYDGLSADDLPQRKSSPTGSGHILPSISSGNSVCTLSGFSKSLAIFARSLLDDMPTLTVKPSSRRIRSLIS